MGLVANRNQIWATTPSWERATIGPLFLCSVVVCGVRWGGFREECMCSRSLTTPTQRHATRPVRDSQSLFAGDLAQSRRVVCLTLLRGPTGGPCLAAHCRPNTNFWGPIRPAEIETSPRRGGTKKYPALHRARTETFSPPRPRFARSRIPPDFSRLLQIEFGRVSDLGLIDRGSKK
jgi:hypothetical protein